MRASLSVSRFARVFQFVHRHLAERRGRALLPDGVDRVGLDRHQLGAGLGAGGFQPLHCRRSVQPRVESEAVAGLELLRQPGFRRRLDQRGHGPGAGVDLLSRLQGVAAVHEQHRTVLQHGGKAGRAGKAREPGQPLVRRRHIFVLMGIGAGHDEAAQVAPRELLAQGGEAGAERHPAFRVFECLEMRFEHGLALRSPHPAESELLSVKFGTIHA